MFQKKKKKNSQKNTCIGVPFLIKLQEFALPRSAFNKYLRTTNSLASHFIVTHYAVTFTIYLFLNFSTLCSDIVAIRPSFCYRYVLDRIIHLVIKRNVIVNIIFIWLFWDIFYLLSITMHRFVNMIFVKFIFVFVIDFIFDPVFRLSFSLSSIALLKIIQLAIMYFVIIRLSLICS